MTKKSNQITLEQGSEKWHEWRRLATQAIPNRRSALWFLNYHILDRKDAIPMTYRAHYAMCLFAEGATGIPEIDSARVKMLLVPRGIGKTGLVTSALPILKLLKHDDYSIGIANEKADLAEGMLGTIKTEFETNALLRHLWPEKVPDDFRATVWRSDRIVITRKKQNAINPSVLATGVGGTVTGVHLHEWIADDLISQAAADNALRGSFSEIEATNRWLVRLQPLLKNPKKDPITLIGTRWWEGDTYEFAEKFWGGLKESDDLAKIPPDFECLWTLRLPDGETQQIRLYRRGEIAVFKRAAIEQGRAIFPERYDLQDLEKMQAEDPVFYAGQYLLEPAAGGASEFNRDWLKTYEWDGPTQLWYRNETGKVEYVQLRDLAIAISVDPAFSDKHTAARSAIPVVGIHGSKKFLLEDFAMHGLAVDGIAGVVVEFCKRYRPHHIFVETIVAQVAVADAIRRIAREQNVTLPGLEEISSQGRERKDWRIYGLQPDFKRGEFYYHKTQANFLREYVSFPRGQLRDILDALAFQRDFWARAATLAGTSGPGADRKAMHERAIARIKAAVGKGGGY